MDAVVTIKLNPREFDLVRKAIENDADKYRGIFKTAEFDAATRHEARAIEAQLRAILEKLQ
jgi:hypothetical protein